MKSVWTVVAAIICSVLTFGCSKSEEHVDAEGCEHLREGPSIAVSAAATGSGAPAIDADHNRYDVTLSAVSGGLGGFVSYAAPEATDYLFFLGAAVPVQFLDAANVVIALEEEATGSTACTEIKGRYLVPLQVGTYTLRLGPTAQTSVAIVVEEAGHAPH